MHAEAKATILGVCNIQINRTLYRIKEYFAIFKNNINLYLINEF